MKNIIEELQNLEDPQRQWENLRHKLVDIVFIGLVSVICGGSDYEHMEDTGHGKLEWFKERLELPNGIPDSAFDFSATFSCPNVILFSATHALTT